MFKERTSNVLLFCTIVTIASAVLQYIYPGLSFFDSGLVIAILLTILVKDNRYTRIFGGASICLIILASFYSPEGIDHNQLIIQHFFSLIIVIMTMLLVLYVKKLYRSIESEQNQVNALFEHATEGIILTDHKGSIVLLNPAASRLFDYDREELLGKSIEMLIPNRFHQAHTGYREGFYKHPANRTMGHGRDLYAKKKGGQEFPVEVSLSHFQQNGNFFVIAFLVDITQRKQSEKELITQKQKLEGITGEIRQLNAELETKVEQRTQILREALQELERSQQELSEALEKEKELNEIKSRFVSMASHEFRTPLSTVLSSAALLGRYTQSEDQDKRDKHIRRIKDSVKHLNDLLEDFLSLGKLEEGKIRAIPASFPMHEFLEECVEEVKAILKSGQKINCDYQGGKTLVSDKRLLKNILINLLGNASKFSEDNASVWLKANHEKDQGLELSIRDEGIGISPEDQQHLFSSFFRGANAINIEGTGLGLHIVKRYVELLGGRIHLDSTLGQGTTISIYLPECPAPEQEG